MQKTGISKQEQRIRRRIRRWIGRGWRLLRLALLLIVLLLLLSDGISVDRTLRGRAVALVRDHLYDYVGWEADALWGKLRQELFGVHPYLDEARRETLVYDYLTRLAEAQALEAQIEYLYADPAITDPAAASADLRARRDALRAELAGDQPLVESIIEGQVSAVLVDQGFGTLGQVLPPVSMHFTPLPTLLVISPRDRIEFAVDLSLEPIPLEQRDAIERRVAAELDVAALIVPLGGISLYPSMVIETADLARAYEVTAHEWAHHYLTFFPLGLEYTLWPESRIINETVATFFGQAVARQVIARYFPDQPLPVYPSFHQPPPPALPLDPAAPEPIDFGRALHTTRVTVDWLLRHGWIKPAEAYMEAQRRLFVQHGYPIRKLNQAYFAFYGGYQGAPGAGGADPIGPAVEELLLLSPDLASFLETVRGITARDELLAALESARAAAPYPDSEQ
ncbi:MAG: hypothetical protein GXY36_19455 [Chloroflexi bacterium]|nr:hypothetical protein [Chloroflexota bacterium]